MALSAPSWRLPIRCAQTPIAQYQRRTAASSSNNDGSSSGSNPVLEEYLRNNPQEAQSGRIKIPEGMGQAGDIANSSIFEDERRAQKQTDSESKDGVDGDSVRVGGIARDPRAMATVLDPNPSAREQWEKRQVVKMIRKNGRLTKEQFIKRTEREHLAKSHNMKTSVKKLGMLARQIAGKTIDDAIVQMRFSKKKVAQEVLKQLEAARDEAVVMRGMGLGNGARKEAEDFNESSSSVTGTTSQTLEETASLERKPHTVDIQLKSGQRHTVSDRSKIYIDQAWVGRGPYGKLPDYRARGRIYMMRTPWTSLSVVLKEEATRVREWEQREAKRQRQLKAKAWKMLPDKPIQIQRQWYSW
ncbi:hypothetical protein M409DRAFT_65005 [Zasmidium cellare ATCC 36951]|uniref:Ribosomal protein L22 n=1 Tax=Zasmidium cellare ATCC 36951 TaxID=1080233 RepID=A0A6A6CT06_ZASCE|nr:uncharacterized protein M409DRAFT_65005 [Zasmidium cellare ATCC 36951]KAF2169290.1 hypothetical protein M409DRAFT_65005 [Zasmidium cellare ATCC 36951]